MNIEQMLDIMQSDMKLWDMADTKEQKNGRVTKTLSLPWGIGEVVVELEGMTDARKRRAAVEGYGQYIRDLIKERIDDEAITSRAKAAAARSEQADSKDRGGVSADGAGGVPQDSRASPTIQSTDEEDTRDVEDNDYFRAALAAREAKLERRIERAEADIARWDNEIKAMAAALAAMRYTHV